MLANWLGASYLSYYFLMVRPDEEREKVLRRVVIQNVKQNLLDALSDEEKVLYEQNEELMERDLEKLKPLIDKRVKQRVDEHYKYGSAAFMMATPLMSTFLLNFIAKKYVGKMVLNTVAMNPKRAVSLDLYFHSMNPFRTYDKPIRVESFTRLAVADPLATKPQVIFTPVTTTEASRVTGKTVYYYSSSQDDAKDIHARLADCGLVENANSRDIQ